MILLEVEGRNMAEGVNEETVAQKGKNVDDSDRYLESFIPNDTSVMENLDNKKYWEAEKVAREKRRLEPPPATKETPTVEERRNPRKPVWDRLNDPGEMAVLKRRAFLEQLRQETERGKGLQAAQLQWNEAKSRREERRQRTSFFDRLRNLRNIGKGKRISEFLSRPNKETAEVQTQTARNAAKILRSKAGFLRGLGAATFAGSKEGILAGTKTFSAKMQENSKSQRGSRAGSAPPPITF